MSRERLILLIPADARPLGKVDMAAMCSPSGAAIPARFRQSRKVGNGPSPEQHGPDSAARSPQPSETVVPTAPMSLPGYALADANVETRRLAADVDRFIEAETAAAPPLPQFEDEYEPAVISGGVLSGIGTLLGVVLFLTIATSIVGYMWVRLSGGQSAVLGTGAQPKPGAFFAPNAVKGVPKPSLASSLAIKPGASKPPGVPFRKSPKPERMQAEESAATESRTLGLGFGAEMGVDAKSPIRVVPGLDMGGAVGVEEDRPGLVDRVELLRAKAVEFAGTQRLRDAIVRYKRILKLLPNDADALFRSGTLHYRLEELSAARDILERAVRLRPGDSRARNNLGLVARAQGHLDESQRILRRAARDASPDALVNLANDFARSGQTATAATFYRKALALEKDHREGRYGLALALIKLDESEAAGEILKGLTKEKSMAARAHLSLGLLARGAGRAMTALRHLRAALRLDPQLSEARMELAMEYLAADRPTKAETQLSTVIAEHKRDPLAWMNMGIVQVRLGALLKAKQCYEFSIRLDPKNPRTHFNYALCAERFGNYLIALEEYEEALKSDPGYWQAAFNMGRIYARGGKQERALENFDRVVGMRAGYSPAQLERARALIDLGRDGEAIGALRNFLRLADKSDALLPSVRKQVKALEARRIGSPRRPF